MLERLRFAGRGTLVQPEALEHMLRHSDPEGLAEMVIAYVPADRMMITLDDLRAVLERMGLDGKAAGADAPPASPSCIDPDDQPSSYPKTGMARQGRKLPAGRIAPEGRQVLQEEEDQGSSGSESCPPDVQGEIRENPAGPKLPDTASPAIVEAPGQQLPAEGRPAVSPAPGPPPGLRVIKDVTGLSTCTGHIEDFVHCFNDRMGRLRRILRNRRELNGAVPVGALKARRHEREIRTIAMVTEVRRTPNGRIIADIEDETGTFRLLLPAEERPPINLMKDEVVGVVGKLSNEGDIIWVQSIVRPDVPLSREPRRAKDPVCAAFISDIHLGSKTFLENDWRRFIAWLNGRETRHQDLVRRLEYIVVAGDIVDGIGIYPDQEEDLLIRDVYRQYQVLGEMLKDVPDRIRILMLPGNHDAVRPAEPQPTFPPEITKLFDSRITFLGNPCQFSLEGVEILAYHGMSIADFISTIPGLSFNTPIEVMKEMLRRRHLAPVFGDKTPLAPENRDWMVMDSIPDIFVTGHVHGAGMENYRGIVLINASTWQSQTDYQRMMNFQPQPAKVAVVDLHSLDWRTVSFDGQQ